MGYPKFRRIRPNPELVTIVYRRPLWQTALLLGLRHPQKLSRLMNATDVAATEGNIQFFERLAEAVRFDGGDPFFDQVAEGQPTDVEAVAP